MSKPDLTFDVVTTKLVAEHRERVDFVGHNDDGTWEASGETDADDDDDLVVVTMQQLVAREPSLARVARMPAGWSAWRLDGDHWAMGPEAGDGFASVPEQGYVVDVGRASKFGHRFCGEHDIAGAHCPNCRKPMLRLLSLDTSDARLGLAKLGVPFVHLLFCWTCNLAQGETSYRLHSDGGIELLVFRRGGVEKDFPYANYPRSFPGQPCELVAVPAREQKVIDALNAGERGVTDLPQRDGHLSVPRHHVGGRPRLMQGTVAASCPECATPMALVASCGDDTGGGRGFTGNAFVQVTFMLCIRDRIVTSNTQCD